MATPFGEYIVARRTEAGLNQTELAERAGMGRAHLSEIERGKIAFPSADLRRRLAAALGVTHLDLLIAAGELAADEVTSAGMVATPVDDDERTTELVELVRQGDWSDDHWYDAATSLVDAIVREQRGKR